MKERREYYIAEIGDEGPLSQFLRRKAGLTPHQIRSAKFRPQGICVNGAQARVTAEIKAGDCVSILLERTGEPASAQSDRSTQNTVPDILYEDEDLLIVNKPAGVAMHPAHGHFGDTLTDMAAEHFRAKGEERQIRSVGRLDKDTSGIVVFAKNKIAAARLSGKSRGSFAGGCEKEYLAVCEGHLKEDGRGLSVHLPMRRVPGELNRMEVCPAGEGMEAHTYIEKIRECGENDLLRVRITTGRTHQIRVHLAALGHPLAGDTVYGSAGPGEAADAGIRRAALHCARVRFRHPLRGEIMELEAPLPEDMRRLTE